MILVSLDHRGVQIRQQHNLKWFQSFLMRTLCCIPNKKTLYFAFKALQALQALQFDHKKIGN